MRLSTYLRSELVLTELSAHDVEEVVRRLAAHLHERGAVDSAAVVEEALLKRERQHSTAMGHGMALPHATIAGLQDPVLMVALARRPIPFGPPESDPVQIFFVLLSPPGRENEHIKILARICRLVRHSGFVEDLQQVDSAEEAVGVIERVDGQHV